MKYKIKNKGISLLIAMGGSFLVLIMAFATLLSIQKMLSQVESLERSTRLFFAAESGIEAALYHHNARGAGLKFDDISSATNSQKIPHLNSSIIATWTVQGRAKPVVGLLREGQTVQIPLHWDSSTNPTKDPTSVANQDHIGGDATAGFSLTFYNDSDDMNAAEKSIIENLTDGRIQIPNSFDFGDDGDGDDTDGDNGTTDNEILIDWSISRMVSGKGIQTFSPKANDCTIGAAPSDFICEQDILLGKQTISSNAASDTHSGRKGRVLPGYPSDTVTLADFMSCNDSPPSDGGNCSDYTLTFRPLLKFKNTTTGTKLAGIPYVVEGFSNGGSTKKAIPTQTYKIKSVVDENNFSQAITLEVPEKTSIGAFDYVIFD